MPQTNHEMTRTVLLIFENSAHQHHPNLDISKTTITPDHNFNHHSGTNESVINFTSVGNRFLHTHSQASHYSDVGVERSMPVVLNVNNILILSIKLDEWSLSES